MSYSVMIVIIITNIIIFLCSFTLGVWVGKRTSPERSRRKLKPYSPKGENGKIQMVESVLNEAEEGIVSPTQRQKVKKFIEEITYGNE